jgi:predicted phosphodiesterase
MRIGILADIHEEVEALREGLGLLQRERVDRVVVLGDLFYHGKRVLETSDLLTEAGAVGVWGNHDLGLCHEPSQDYRDRYPRRLFDYLETLRPRLELDGCLFCHGLPHWDAYDPTDYYLSDRLETPEGLSSSFSASPCLITFVGHFHRWQLATPEGVSPWSGGTPLSLGESDRYLVVVAAVCDGWCAVYDTESGELIPHRLAGAGVEKV